MDRRSSTAAIFLDFNKAFDEKTQRSAARHVTGLLPRDPLQHNILLARAVLEPLASRRQLQEALLVYRLIQSSRHLPTHLFQAFNSWHSSSAAATTSVNLRSSSQLSLCLPRPRTDSMRLPLSTVQQHSGTPSLCLLKFLSPALGSISTKNL